MSNDPKSNELFFVEKWQIGTREARSQEIEKRNWKFLTRDKKEIWLIVKIKILIIRGYSPSFYYYIIIIIIMRSEWHNFLILNQRQTFWMFHFFPSNVTRYYISASTF